MRRWDDAAVDFETVSAGEEGSRRLVFADLGVEVGGLGEGDIGRVGDDGVEVAVLLGGWKLGEKVGVEEADPGGEVVVGDVGFGDGKSGGGEVERGDLRVGEVGGQRDSDGSGADTDVGDCDGLVMGETLEN